MSPLAQGFFYSRGKVGVRAGFPAAISPSPVAAVPFFYKSFASGIWEPSPSGRNRGELLMPS